MSFHLAYASDSALLSSSRAVIKQQDRVAFGEAITLLQETTALRDRARDSAASARNAARLNGLAEARAAADEMLTTGLAEVVRAVDAHAEIRRADIAEAAFAAARAIIGALDDNDIIQRIIDRTIARIDGDTLITIEVAPAMVDGLVAHLANLKHVTIAANSEFAATDCRILAPSGQIVASLSVQFDALAARWGL